MLRGGMRDLCWVWDSSQLSHMLMTMCSCQRIILLCEHMEVCSVLSVLVSDVYSPVRQSSYIEP